MGIWRGFTMVFRPELGTQHDLPAAEFAMDSMVKIDQVMASWNAGTHGIHLGKLSDDG